ncbi:alpha/beta hydrolase family esterase [Streptomyces lancefieldiae]|uniref:PHB depolymerase family esterase n=1 Tax=Streptomyces lancefieldiae TaxID=3075520 RepID=A0ABU3AUK4_9ACTN|nr:PHB depolymerase family esterase [Streptomyces sp. DSM 40712]MDT0613277.1 PHB depolymerase family esterase [Streptomyces sp. DSM 40712]
MRSFRDPSGLSGPSFRPRRWPAALAVALALPLAGCATESGRPDTAPPASSPSRAGGTATAAPEVRAQLRVDGHTRGYLLHRPAADGPRPLVIAFHGRGADAAEMREKSRLEKAAGARGMLVAYPEGLDHGWGAGTRATDRRPDPDLDVRFTEALIKHLVRTERADPERVYVAGFSNGGSMALRMAAQRPGLLAGAASVSGQLPTGDAAVKPTGPVPVMVVYGADDPVRPLAGWPSPPPDPEEPILPTLSARASAEAFATAGGAGEPVTEEEKGYDRTVWHVKDTRGTPDTPEVPETSHAPKAPDTSHATEEPEASNVPQGLGASEGPGGALNASDTPEGSGGAPKASKGPNASVDPGAPDASGAPDTPEGSGGAPKASKGPNASEGPGAPDASGAPDTPEGSGHAPKASKGPNASVDPGAPDASGAPDTPEGSGHAPKASKGPNASEGPGAPDASEDPGAPKGSGHAPDASHAPEGPGGGPVATVQLLVVHDAGHTWPGSSVTPPKGFGPTSKALDATDTILDFFAAG